MGKGVISLDVLIELVKSSDSWDDFKDKVTGLSKVTSITYVQDDKKPPEEPLSDFNQKLKQGLEWNPKEHKK